MSRSDLFLGITCDGEVAFGHITLGEIKQNPYLGAAFETVRPICSEDFNAKEMYEDYVEDIDDAYKYQLCERLDCKPNELAEALLDDEQNNTESEICGLLDVSLFPEHIYIDVDDETRHIWEFESACGGQHDLEEEGMAFTMNKNAYDRMQKIWHEWHLKPVDKVPGNIVADVKAINNTFMNQYDNHSEIEDVLTKYIKACAYDKNGDLLSADERFTPELIETFAKTEGYIN